MKVNITRILDRMNTRIERLESLFLEPEKEAQEAKVEKEESMIDKISDIGNKGKDFSDRLNKGLNDAIGGF